MAVAAIIVVDICVTLGLLLLVYYWSKNRKAKAKPVTRGKAAGGRPRGETMNRGGEGIPTAGRGGGSRPGTRDDTKVATERSTSQVTVLLPSLEKRRKAVGTGLLSGSE